MSDSWYRSDRGTAYTSRGRGSAHTLPIGTSWSSFHSIHIPTRRVLKRHVGRWDGFQIAKDILLLIRKRYCRGRETLPSALWGHWTDRPDPGWWPVCSYPDSWGSYRKNRTFAPVYRVVRFQAATPFWSIPFRWPRWWHLPVWHWPGRVLQMQRYGNWRNRPDLWWPLSWRDRQIRVLPLSPDCTFERQWPIVPPRWHWPFYTPFWSIRDGERDSYSERSAWHRTYQPGSIESQSHPATIPT